MKNLKNPLKKAYLSNTLKDVPINLFFKNSYSHFCLFKPYNHLLLIHESSFQLSQKNAILQEYF